MVETLSQIASYSRLRQQQQPYPCPAAGASPLGRSAASLAEALDHEARCHLPQPAGHRIAVSAQPGLYFAEAEVGGRHQRQLVVVAVHHYPGQVSHIAIPGGFTVQVIEDEEITVQIALEALLSAPCGERGHQVVGGHEPHREVWHPFAHGLLD